MMCPNCGAAIPEGTKFCTSCGAAAPVSQQQYSAPQQQYSAPQQQYSAPQQQYYAPQPQYAYNATPVANVSSTPALVWGILGLCFACSFYLSFLGIIFSAIGLGKAKSFVAATGVLSGKAKVGKILSIVGLILGIVLTVICVIVIIGLAAELS